MSRLDDWLTLIDHPEQRLDGNHPADDALATLLVQLAFSDGLVQEDELAFFRRVSPPNDVLGWVESRAVRPVDLVALGPLVASDADKRKLLDLAVRVVGLDSAVATEEVVHLHRIVGHLELSHDAIRSALDEVVAAGGPVAPERVVDVAATMTWRSLYDLSAPVGSDAVRVLGRADVPEVAIHPDGIWARFDRGEARVGFDEIVAYTRLPVRGRAFYVRTDHADHVFVDPAFRDLGILLDRLYGR